MSPQRLEILIVCNLTSTICYLFNMQIKNPKLICFLVTII